MNSVDRLFSNNFMTVMTNTKGIMTIIAIATILITGSFVIAPYAYSTGYNDDSNDDSHDDSNDDSHDDSNGDCHDDSNGDCEPDPCDCKKPDKFTVRYQGPGTEENPAMVEIYKKTEKIGDKDPLVSGIEVFVNDDPNDGSDLIVVSASDFGKKKLGSNTGYRILWDDPMDDPDAGLVEIARIDIHTSCSKLLYIGQTFTDGGVILTVEDGTINGKTSIPISDPLTCEADQKPIPMSSITVKKALTNDNNGQAGPEDFTVILTEIGEDGLVDTADDTVLEPQTFNAMDSSFSVTIPAGTYIMSESVSTEFDGKYTPVMIAGDTACPSMEGEPFKLKKDKQITCTIYNDDNFVPGQVSSGEAGVVFHFGFVNFHIPSAVGFCGDTATFPCIDFEGNSFIIVPNIDPNDPNVRQLSDTTIVLLTVLDISNPTQNVGCQVTGIDTHMPSNRMGFIMKCPDLVGLNELDTFNANFALIETDDNK